MLKICSLVDMVVLNTPDYMNQKQIIYLLNKRGSSNAMSLCSVLIQDVMFYI